MGLSFPYAPVFILSCIFRWYLQRSNHFAAISTITPGIIENTIIKTSLLAVSETTHNSVNSAYSVYDSIHLDGIGLSRETFNYATYRSNYLVQTGKLVNDKIISIVDFSLPSSAKRLFVIDLDNYKNIFRTVCCSWC